MARSSLVQLHLARSVIEALDRLVELGIFGVSREDVAERLLLEQLRIRAIEGWVQLPGLRSEDGRLVKIEKGRRR